MTGIITHNKNNNYVGWLGNRMFMYAATVGIALKNGIQYSFPPHEYLDYFKGDFYVNPNIKDLQTEELNIDEFNYRDIILNQNLNYNLYGYFQSAKYWENYETLIHELFEFKNEICFSIPSVYSDILKHQPVGIHVRRGDYLKLPDHHPSLPLEYYNKAIAQFDKTQKFLVFSDDTEYCEKHFIGSNFTIIKGGNAAHDMCLMSLCAHQIIANSSFSWWASYLNKNVEKKIIAPSKDKWFGIAYKDWDVNDLYLSNWILI